MYRFKLYHDAIGEVELKHAPVGWEEPRFLFKRDKRYHGMSREYTVDLEFVKDGFDYIHSVYETFGIHASVIITVYAQDPHNFLFNMAYQGILALEEWKVIDGVNGSGLRGVCNVDFIGFTQRFVNNEEVAVNLLEAKNIHGHARRVLDVPAVELHSLGILKNYAATNTISVAQTCAFMQNAEDRKANIIFGFDDVTTNELKAYQYGSGTVGQNLLPEIFTSEGHGTYTIDARVSGYFTVFADVGDFDTLEFWVYAKIGNKAPIPLFYGIDPGVAKTGTVPYDVPYKTTIELQDEESFYFYGTCLVSDTSGNLLGEYVFHPKLQLNAGSYLKISGRTYTDKGNVWGMLVHEAFATVASSITGYHNAFYSDLFGRRDSLPVQYPVDGDASQLFLTNGFGLRGFPQVGTSVEPILPAGAGWFEKQMHQVKLLIYQQRLKDEKSMFMSFRELFDAMDAVFCIGAGVELVNGEMVVRVEKRSFFYNSDIVLELGMVSGLSKRVDTESYYNEAEFGYQNWKIEDVNGLKEFNAKQDYTLPVEKVKKKYTATTRWIGGGYKIESTRRDQYELNASKDGKDDDNIFMICVERAGMNWKSETGGAFLKVEEVENPQEAYNLRITPGHMRDNHLPELRRSFYKLPDGVLHFNKGEGNTKVAVTTLQGQVTRNGVDVKVSEMPQSIDLPEIYEFEHPLKHQELRVIRENPYGIVKFRDASGTPCMGHIQELDATDPSGLTKFILRRVYEA